MGMLNKLAKIMLLTRDRDRIQMGPRHQGEPLPPLTEEAWPGSWGGDPEGRPLRLPWICVVLLVVMTVVMVVVVKVVVVMVMILVVMGW